VKMMPPSEDNLTEENPVEETPVATVEKPEDESVEVPSVATEGNPKEEEEPTMTAEEEASEAASLKKAEELLAEKKDKTTKATSFYDFCLGKCDTLDKKREECESVLEEAQELLRKMKSDDEEVVIPVDDDAVEFSPERAFAVFDADGSGGIDRAELKNAIAAVNNKIADDEEIDVILSKYNLNADGQLKLDEFKKLCKSKKLNLKKRRMSVFKKKVVQSEEDAAAVEAIKHELLVKELLANAEEGFKVAEASLESTLAELKNAKDQLEESEKMKNKAEEEASRQETVLKDIKEGAWSAERIFAAFDADNNGTLDISELQLALTALLGMKVGESLVKKFAKKYDVDGDGNLDFEEFSKCSAEAKKTPAAFFNNMFSFGNADDAREKVTQLEANLDGVADLFAGTEADAETEAEAETEAKAETKAVAETVPAQ